MKPLVAATWTSACLIDNPAYTGSAGNSGGSADPDTMAPGDAFYTMDNVGDGCDDPLIDRKDWYIVPSAHYCIDADIAPA